jgi:hypothetical protein
VFGTFELVEYGFGLFLVLVLRLGGFEDSWGRAGEKNVGSACSCWLGRDFGVGVLRNFFFMKKLFI